MCKYVSKLNIKQCIVRTRLRHGRQISADTLELSRRQGDRSSILSLWDTEMLLINIHELDIILAYTVALWALKNQVDNIWRILRLQCEDILVLSTAENLCERGEVDTEGDITVAAVWREGLGLQHHRDERDVGVVHSLERDPGVIAIEVAVLDQVLDGIDNLKSNQNKSRGIKGMGRIPSSAGWPVRDVLQAL